MKSKYAIIREEYNPETFESVVEIETDIGRFVGKTVADEQDRLCPSMWQGNQIALGKAQKKFAKAAIRILKAEVTTYEKVYNTFEPIVDHIWDFPEWTDFMRNYNSKRKELELWQTRLAIVGISIKNRVDARDKITAKYIAEKVKEG